MHEGNHFSFVFFREISCDFVDRTQPFNKGVIHEKTRKSHETTRSNALLREGLLPKEAGLQFTALVAPAMAWVWVSEGWALRQSRASRCGYADTQWCR